MIIFIFISFLTIMNEQKIFDLEDKIAEYEDIVADLLEEERYEEAKQYQDDLEVLKQKLEKEKRIQEKTFEEF